MWWLLYFSLEFYTSTLQYPDQANNRLCIIWLNVAYSHVWVVAQNYYYYYCSIITGVCASKVTSNGRLRRYCCINILCWR